MKSVLVIFVLVMVAAAEPPRYRQRLQRLEEAPYPASGYRPAGAQFRLPSRLENLPERYGPPEETTTEVVTTEEPSTTTIQPQSEKLINGREEQAEEVEVDNAEEKQNEQNDQPQKGVYYILLPTGQLQKVQYLTAGDVANSAYTAELQFQNVAPIRGPVYAFGPNAQLIQYV